MLDGVQGFISKVLRNERLSSFSEDQAKLAIILPLLHELGWNVFNDEEVVPEYSLGRKRVDYALRTGNSSKVFIEAKKCSVDLDDSRWQEQLLNYAFQEGVKLAILTNGISWWFYLPLREGNWEQRKFDSIDLNQPSPENVANRFVEFLSKDNVISGKSVESAERVISSRQRARVVKDTLPKAWDDLISEPDELLIELLKDKVKNLCGFSPTPSELISFVKDIQKNRAIEIPTPPRRESTVPDSSQIQVGQKRKSHSKGRWTRLVVRFPNGRVIESSKAADSFVAAIEELGIEEVRSLGLTLNKGPLISIRESEDYSYQHRSGRYYINTHSSTKKKKALLEDMARRLGVRIDVKII